MIRIRYSNPYSLDRDLATAYNEEMALGGADYVCFLDRDTWIPDPHYGHTIASIVEANRGAYLTCRTNRTNSKWQRWETDAGDDIRQHITVAKDIWSKYGSGVSDHTFDQLWSGHLMLCPVDGWTPLEGGALLGADNEIHRNVIAQGRRVLLMEGVYIYHWYSGFDGPWEYASALRDKSHLKNV